MFSFIHIFIVLSLKVDNGSTVVLLFCLPYLDFPHLDFLHLENRNQYNNILNKIFI